MTSKSYIAYMEDAPEDDASSTLEGIEGTRMYAFSEAPTQYKKERPNTGKSRAERRTPRRSNSSGNNNSNNEAESARRNARREREREAAQREYEREREREEREERERERNEAAERRRSQKKSRDVELKQKKPKPEPRPPKDQQPRTLKKVRPTSLTQSKTDTVVQQYKRGHVGPIDEPNNFGIQPASGRPRAQSRPSSFYHSQVPGPPISHVGWHQHHQLPPPGAYPIPTGHIPSGSFPTPPPMYGGSPSMTGVPASPASTAPSFFDQAMTQSHDRLRNRFERPASAIGFRQTPPGPSFFPPPEVVQDESEQRIVRRPSRSRKQTEDDRKRMPPPDFIPPRPMSALPAGTAYRPPPPQPQQHTPQRQKSRPPTSRSRVGFADQRGFDDEDIDGLFTDSPDAAYERRNSKAIMRARRPSVSYEQRGVDIIPASRRGRSNSFYAGTPGSGGASLEDDKYMTALQYQDDVNGSSSMPLTADALRKASDRAIGGGSSRSTRSSESRDESEFRHSHTTGLTRSSSSDTDNVTIKVSGSAVVRVQGAEIECGDGGEITFSTRPSGSSRAGSDRASTVYQLEDGRSRVERKALPYHTRAPSQSDTQSRMYALSHAPYDPTLCPDDYMG